MLQEAIEKVVNQFTKLNRTLVNAVNKGATSMTTFKEDVYEWMQDNIPTEFQDVAYEELVAALWNYDILKPLIYDDGSISDIACHAWNNVWIMVRGKWKECDFHFRDEEHYRMFFNHVCTMNKVLVNERKTFNNCTDIDTCPDFRLRISFIHSSVNTDGSNVLFIRKIPTHKKTFEDLAKPEEGMLSYEMLPVIRKHIKDATGILIVGMSGSGKTTFLNALLEELPTDWKFLIAQENEELFSNTHRNSNFLHTVQGINEYDISHDLKEIAKQSLLMANKCCIIGETKGEEALQLLNFVSNGGLGITTAHSDSSVNGLYKLCDYIKYSSDYTQEQCLAMLTVINKVFFLESYRLKEISTIKGYDKEKNELILETEYYNN